MPKVTEGWVHSSALVDSDLSDAVPAPTDWYLTALAPFYPANFSSLQAENMWLSISVTVWNSYTA